jgi:hypothetical protein
MANHTNTDRNLKHDEPGMIFIFLVIFLVGTCILCMLSQLCWGTSICEYIRRGFKKCTKRGCFRLYEEEGVIEYEVESDSESDIEEVKKPDIKVNKVPTFANINNYPIYCSICQEEEMNTVKVDCGHNYCKECIMGYTKVSRECPNCRENIKGIYEIEVLILEV